MFRLFFRPPSFVFHRALTSTPRSFGSFSPRLFSSSKDDTKPLLDDFAFDRETHKPRREITRSRAPHSIDIDTAEEIRHRLEGNYDPERCEKEVKSSLDRIDFHANSSPRTCFLKKIGGFLKKHVSCILPEFTEAQLKKFASKVFYKQNGFGRIVIDDSLYSTFSKLGNSFPGDPDTRAKLLFLYALNSDTVPFLGFCKAFQNVRVVSDEAVAAFLEELLGRNKKWVLINMVEEGDDKKEELFEAVIRFINELESVLFLSNSMRALGYVNNKRKVTSVEDTWMDRSGSCRAEFLEIERILEEKTYLESDDKKKQIRGSEFSSDEELSYKLHEIDVKLWVGIYRGAPNQRGFDILVITRYSHFFIEVTTSKTVSWEKKVREKIEKLEKDLPKYLKTQGAKMKDIEFVLRLHQEAPKDLKKRPLNRPGVKFGGRISVGFGKPDGPIEWYRF